MLRLNEAWVYFAAALALSVILMPLLRQLSFRLGAVDKGEGRRVHQGIVPRLGGIGIFLAFLLPTLFTFISGGFNDATHFRYLGILSGSLIIVLLGLYDDLKGAKVSYKLMAEVLAAMLIYAWGIRIEHLSIPFGGSFALGWLSLPATILWIVVITNAINLIDGLDGLAAGTGIIVALTLLLTTDADSPHLALTCIILIGALAGFLIYNFPPASIFMGDAGSLFIGFLLGTLSINYSVKSTALATMMIPLIAFSIPLVDMSYAVVRRYYRGLALGSPDREHIHHKLLEMGLSKRMVIGVIYAINVLIMMLALFVIDTHERSSVWVFVGLLLVAGAGVRLLGYHRIRPLLASLMRNHELNKRRRYYNFLIREFKIQARRAKSADELRHCLETVVQHYGFSSAGIDLHSGETTATFWKYGKKFTNSGDCLVISIPLKVDEIPFGRMIVTKEMDGEYLLCTSKLFYSISDAMARFNTFEQSTSQPKYLNRTGSHFFAAPRESLPAIAAEP